MLIYGEWVVYAETVTYTQMISRGVKAGPSICRVSSAGGSYHTQTFIIVHTFNFIMSVITNNRPQIYNYVVAIYNNYHWHWNVTRR